MQNISRIRFNPVNKEIEVEGSEKFVKTYFRKIQAMLYGSPPNKSEKKLASAMAASMKKTRNASKGVGKRKVTNVSTIVSLIKANSNGISTTTLKAKTGLSKRQIWTIVDRAAKEGKIRKMQRGLYGGAA